MVVFFFLFVYLFSSTELSELLKMNKLFEHFAEHKEENKNLSIASFLYTHYFQHGDNQRDSEHDNKLPFHSDSVNSTSFIFVLNTPPNSFYFSFFLLNENIEKSNFYAINIALKSSYLSSIWQPPQIA